MNAPTVYPIGSNRKYSIFDLLNNFANSDYHDGYLSRLSDMHVKTGEPVAFRLDNKLTAIDGGAPCTVDMIIDLLYPLLDERQIRDFEAEPTCDIDTGYYWKEMHMAFRINAFRDREGPAFVVRMLPLNIPKVSELGFSSDQVWKDITQLTQGLVLISGVTGSGKSTTMNSILREIAQARACRVITLEDPIEFIHSSSCALISQREIATHVGSFADGLRSALRENPDIILVGEMRDPETIALAMTAAETGHLVFSTIHTRDVRGAITRIMDSFPPERQSSIATQMSFAIKYIISQKLVPKLDGHGRVPAMEVLKVTNSISNQIRQANIAQIYSSMETQTHEGMNTMEKHLSELYQAGTISKEDAEFFANDLKSLDL